MKRKVLLALVLASAILMFSCGDDDDDGDPPPDNGTPGLAYTLNSNGKSYSVSKGTVTGGEVIIPSTYKGKHVTKIGDLAFHSLHGLTKITIPNSVISIGEHAFSWSGLTSVTIPASVTSIGNYAFHYCYALTSVTLFEGLESIGEGAFYGCDRLSSITIPASVKSISLMAFNVCPRLTSITVAEKNSIYSSENGILYNNDKTTLIQVPGGKSGAINISTDITKIEDGAFARCFRLTSITVDENHPSYSSENNILYNKDKTELLAYPSASGNVSIAESVTKIGALAFNHCTGLSSISIPNSVTIIGTLAFEYCDKLTSVTIPSSVTELWYGVFRYCEYLTSVTFEGNNISNFGDHFIGLLANGPDNLRTAYQAPSGGAGTYTRRTAGDHNWTKE